MIGASPWIGGLLGSSIAMENGIVVGGGKKLVRGNSKTRGEKRDGCSSGTAADSGVASLENAWIMGFRVISVRRGDMSPDSHSSGG